jgi:hypothetical protein
MLSIIPMFSVRERVDEACHTTDLLLQFVASDLIIGMAEWISAIAGIVEALRDQTGRIAGFLREFASWAFDESDPQLISRASSLITSLFTWALVEVQDAFTFLVRKI